MTSSCCWRAPTPPRASTRSWTPLQKTLRLDLREPASGRFEELMPKTLAVATVDKLLHHSHVCQTSHDSTASDRSRRKRSHPPRRWPTRRALSEPICWPSRAVLPFTLTGRGSAETAAIDTPRPQLFSVSGGYFGFVSMVTVLRIAYTSRPRPWHRHRCDCLARAPAP